MKTIKVIAIAIFSISCLSSYGQVNGNGNLETRAFNFEGIENINFHVTVDAKLDLSLNDEFFVRTDENIFEHLKVKQKGNSIIIDQIKWIEPTALQITAGLKGLQKLRSTAWGKIMLKNIEQEEFEAQMEVGHLKMEGTLLSLNAQVGAGSIDARKVLVREVNARIDQNGRILTDNTEAINLSGDGYGQFVYDRSDVLTWSDNSNDIVSSTLEEFAFQEENKNEVVYIDFKLKNNSGKKVNIFFRGPIDAPFGYGIPVSAKGVKSERLPVGTRIYQETLIGKDKLLLTITQDNRDKIINLFESGY